MDTRLRTVSHTSQVVEAATSAKKIGGYTHTYYRYPARFSPLLIRELITQFSTVGDLVIDPFLGGGTTDVESRILGRQFLGTDINSLATFVAKVKTTSLSKDDEADILDWTDQIHSRLNLRNKVEFDETWSDQQRNLGDKRTWPIKKVISLAIKSVVDLPPRQQAFARCCILNTAQWALDAKKAVPSVDDFRKNLIATTTKMLSGMSEYSSAVKKADSLWLSNGVPRTKIVNRSAVGLENEPSVLKLSFPKLIITSPPYPGVHMLYHRWQILGRRETPAPYWIANQLDGNGLSYYTFGDRHEEGLSHYFSTAFKAFSSIAAISSPDTIIAQVIGFSEPGWQLPAYLETMKDAGLVEIHDNTKVNYSGGRLWRDVPNRKWFASHKGATCGSREVVLFHRIKC